MPQQRQYADAAARQRAYRTRQAQARHDGGRRKPGNKKCLRKRVPQEKRDNACDREICRNRKISAVEESQLLSQNPVGAFFRARE